MIQESLKTALAGKTVVLVAHRLSTIKDADLIYVLHQGRVVEQGTHRQLLARSGWYSALWRSQTDDSESVALSHSVVGAANGRNGNGSLLREGVNHE